MTVEEMVMYDQLVDMGIATADELNLARNLMAGEWMEVLNAVLFIRTGYRTMAQMMEAEDEDFE